MSVMVLSLVLAVGVALASGGGELFVRGAVGVATARRIPPAVVGATVAAFATSSPELAVGLVAAAGGDGAVALGDATGSNLVNLGVILGTVVVVLTVEAARDDVRRDLVAAMSVLVAVAALGADGVLDRVDAVALFAGFGVWLTATIRSVRTWRSDGSRSVAGDGGADPPVGARPIVSLVAGLARWTVGAASGSARRWVGTSS
jgi:cation:H+ antiporter